MKKLTVSLRRYEAIVGTIYIPVQLLVFPVVLAVGNFLLPNPLSDAELTFINFALNILGVAVIFHRFLIDSAKEFLHRTGRKLLICLLGFILYWLSIILVNMLVFLLDPGFSNVNDNSILVLLNESPILMTIGVVFLAPLAEEVLYRGVLFGLLYQKKPLVGYIVSAAVFSALHVVSYIGLFSPLRLLLCFFQYIPASLCLAWTYATADSIWASVTIHMLINLIGILFI